MKKSLLLCWLAALISSAVHAIDNPHYWRANNFLPQFYEPRLSKSWLTSFDIFAGYGKTHSSRNGQGQTVPLLARYGPENIAALALGLPNLSFTNPVDITLQNLSLLGCPCGFGELTYGGTFKITELNFCFSQNLACGFFTQVHFPYRQMQISDICNIDDSNPSCATNPNQGNIYWQTFLNLYPQFLTQYNILINSPCQTSVKQNGIGDTSVLLGWAYNYEETEALDYVDFTLRLGVLIPTGKKKNPSVIFDIPNGYNGHIAAPISLDFALGYYEWLTIGTHVGAMIFVRRLEECVRVHTSPAQNGFIKLVAEEAHTHEGTIWELLGYLKADHFAGGFSFLAGYNFALQQRATIKPCDRSVVDVATVNADSTLAGWNMHTVNFMLEYDFTKEESILGPRIGLFYNVQVAGQHIFKTNMVGGFLGFDFSWCF